MGSAARWGPATTTRPTMTTDQHNDGYRKAMMMCGTKQRHGKCSGDVVGAAKTWGERWWAGECDREVGKETARANTPTRLLFFHYSMYLGTTSPREMRTICVLLSCEYYIEILNNIILQEEDVIRWLGHHPLWHGEMNRIAVNIFQMAIYIFLLQKTGSKSQREPQAPWLMRCAIYSTRHPKPSTAIYPFPCPQTYKKW